MYVTHKFEITGSATGKKIELTNEEARDLYLDLAQSTPYRVTTVALRDRLKDLLGIQTCKVSNPDCGKPATESKYRVTCFSNHYRTTQYCYEHSIKVGSAQIECRRCAEDLGQRRKLVLLGVES